MPHARGGGDDVEECPLCMEPLDSTDKSFVPCQCGYQVSKSVCGCVCLLPLLGSAAAARGSRVRACMRRGGRACVHSCGALLCAPACTCARVWVACVCVCGDDRRAPCARAPPLPQICLWCFHRINEQLGARCPACRTPYDKSKVVIRAPPPEAPYVARCTPAARACVRLMGSVVTWRVRTQGSAAPAA